MTCARFVFMFAVVAVATLFQTDFIGAQPMTETEYLNVNRPRRARCCEDEKAIPRGQSCPGNPAWPTGQRHPLITAR